MNGEWLFKEMICLIINSYKLLFTGHYYIPRYLVDADWFVQWTIYVGDDPNLFVGDINITSTQPGPVYNGKLLKGNRNQSCCLNQYI